MIRPVKRISVPGTRTTTFSTWNDASAQERLRLKVLPDALSDNFVIFLAAAPGM
jgi:hypothetical protein